MTKTILISMLMICAMSLSARAQEGNATGQITVELNAAETQKNACTLTFLITNGLGREIDKAVYETVLFDQTGQVNRLTLFDFGALPAARPRVRQFAVPDIACDALGRILFNGANTCEGDGLAPDVCTTRIVPSSRTEIEVLG